MSYVWDTDIWIKYKPPKNLGGYFVSSVVLHELVAGAADDSQIQLFELIRIQANHDDKLLTPTMIDWWEAGKILYRLRQGKKSRAKGITPKLPTAEVQRIMRDTMIARTIKRANATLVTDNIKDFERIRNFCDVKIISGSDYFA